MSLLNRGNFQAHPFHVVSPSLWPINSLTSSLLLICNIVLSIYGFTYAIHFFFLALLSLMLSMFFWFRDIISESTFFRYLSTRCKQFLVILQPTQWLYFVKNKGIFIFNIGIFALFSKITYKLCTNLTQLSWYEPNFYICLLIYSSLCGVIALLARTIKFNAFGGKNFNFYNLFAVSFMLSLLLFPLILYMSPYIVDYIYLPFFIYCWGPSDFTGANNPGSYNPGPNNPGPSNPRPNNPGLLHPGLSDAESYDLVYHSTEPANPYGIEPPIRLTAYSPWYTGNIRTQTINQSDIQVTQNSKRRYGADENIMHAKIRDIKAWNGQSRVAHQEIISVRELFAFNIANDYMRSADATPILLELNQMDSRIGILGRTEKFIEDSKAKLVDRPKMTEYIDFPLNKQGLIRELVNEVRGPYDQNPKFWLGRSYQSAYPLYYATARSDAEVGAIRERARNLYNQGLAIREKGSEPSNPT